MDEGSPNRRLLDIAFEITQCREELARLSQIVDEVEGELGRPYNLTHQDDAQYSTRRSDHQLENHDQAVAHYNKLMMKLHTLNCRVISHPIHRLPQELLEHIFHLLFEIGEDEFPLNLTQVCSQWESVVLSVRNRRLWSTVRIDPVDPDWLERLHLYLFLSRDEGLDIYIRKMTQSIKIELAGHYRRIRSLPGSVISQIWHSTASEPDIIQVKIPGWSGEKSFTIQLSSSVMALAFMCMGQGSLRRLQSFSQLQELGIGTLNLQLLDLGGPLQLPALRSLTLESWKNPLVLLRIFNPSQLLDLRLVIQGSPSPEVYYELETFIIANMPNLQSIVLKGQISMDLVLLQPVEESTTQSASARQNESLRRIDCQIFSSLQGGIPPFNRLIESATHLEECCLDAPINSLPCFCPHIRELRFEFDDSPISPVVNGELFKLVHLEVLRMAFATAKQLQLLTLFQAPSLLSLEVSCRRGDNSRSHSMPVDAILTILSTSPGIHDLKLELPFPVDGMTPSLPELRNLKVTHISHIFLLASFDVPKLQHLFLEIGDRRGEDASMARGQDLKEYTIGITSPSPSFEAVGSSIELDMMNTWQIPEVGEVQKRNILEEDENETETNRFKDTDLREACSIPVVTRVPTFPALTFQHLKDFEFKVITTSGSYPIRALPYFPGIFTAFPALERITLPAVSFNDSPYIDQLVKRISETPTLCPNLQEIRTRDYPNEWSNLLKFLRDRKRASMLSTSTPRPIHALHFPITPHSSIVEQLQDAMLGKVSIKSFPALSTRPLRIDPTLVQRASSWGEDTPVDSDEETRSQEQDGDERTAATRVQAQEEDMMGNADKERQSEEESGSGENEDEALSCCFCNKAGLRAGCQRVFRKLEGLSLMERSSGVELCSRWDATYNDFEVICLP